MSDTLIVYFSEFPELDLATLSKSFDDRDPDEESELRIERVEGDKSKQLSQEIVETAGTRVETFLAELGEFLLPILIHNAASPDSELIEDAPINESVKQVLRGHKAFALLTLHKGEKYHPIERVIALYKLTLAMCDQGAIGFTCPEGHTSLTAEILQDLSEGPKQVGATLWQTLREDKFPKELFVSHHLVDFDGDVYIMTAGHGMLYLPDLCYRIEETGDNGRQKEIERATEWMESIYDYIAEAGPVLQPGHTMEFEDVDGLLKFEAPPKSIEGLQREYGMLRIIPLEGDAKKKAGFLERLFGGG